MFGMRGAARAISLAVTIGLMAAPVRQLRADDAASAPSADAVELYNRASELYRQGRFGEAVDLLHQVQRVKPEPVIHYNLARAYEGLGRWREAIAAYEVYLREDPTLSDRGAIERRLQTLRALEPPAAGAVESTPRGRSYVVPILLVGLGAAAAGSGFVFGGLSRTNEERVDDGRDQRAAHDALGRAEDFATAANISFVVGGVLVAAGVIWFLIDKDGAARTPRPAQLRF
jgi:tetratricopeptide (TPR) repeat protein